MKDVDPALTRVKAEQRRFRRVRVDMMGRLFVPSDSRECQCKVIDLSPGGASLECDMAPEMGTPVVLYLDGFGRLEGTITRGIPGDLGLRFSCTVMKRERIAEQLILFMNRDLIDEAELRRSSRARQKGIARFTRSDGQLVSCEVLDLSVNGVSLKTDVRPPIGEFVLIGQMAGRIARHHDEGIGIEFVGHQPANTLADRGQARAVTSR